MMNFELDYIPNRGEKPRDNGITMMMDKGLSETGLRAGLGCLLIVA